MPEGEFCPEDRKHKPRIACEFRHFCDGVWKQCKYWASGCAHPERGGKKRR